MTISTRQFCKLATLLAGVALAASAQAAPPPPSTWITLTNPPSPFTLEGGNLLYSPAPALVVKYFNGNLTPQSPAAIQAAINAQFSLSGAGALGAAVSACDGATSGCTFGSSAAALSGPMYTNSFTSAAAYDYLAVHFGQGELVFHWSSPVLAGNSFLIGGLPHGLSNYRAYMSPVTSVPEPGAYAMLLAGLGVMGALARRRKPSI